MNFSRFVLPVLLAASFAFAVERIGVPVSPSLWDSYLPNSTHPYYASNLGSLQEGRLTFGFQNADLAHLSLSVPGLQIISANTKWQVKEGQGRWFYNPKYEYLAENGYYRDLFLVAGGSRLSNILSLGNWDLGVGGTFKNLAVENRDEEKIWTDSWLGGSFSLSLNYMLISGYWDKYEQRYLLSYNEPRNWQAGFEFFQSWDDFYSFGLQPGAELFFYDNLKFHGGMCWQFADVSKKDPLKKETQLKRVEFIFNVGLSIRFRPMRSTDPEWLHPIISPFDSKWFYDWEMSFDTNMDVEYSSYNWLISLSKWF
jgi:hypothetical protein